MHCIHACRHLCWSVYIARVCNLYLIYWLTRGCETFLLFDGTHPSEQTWRGNDFFVTMATVRGSIFSNYTQGRFSSHRDAIRASLQPLTSSGHCYIACRCIIYTYIAASVCVHSSPFGHVSAPATPVLHIH